MCTLLRIGIWEVFYFLVDRLCRFWMLKNLTCLSVLWVGPTIR